MAYLLASSAASSAGVGGAEVGAVAGEGVDPLLAGSSRVSATRWAVLASRPRVMPTYADAAPVCSPSTMCAAVVGLALGAVDGGGVGELDVLARVGERQIPVAVLTGELEGAVRSIPVTVQVSRLATPSS